MEMEWVRICDLNRLDEIVMDGVEYIVLKRRSHRGKIYLTRKRFPNSKPVIIGGSSRKVVEKIIREKIQDKPLPEMDFNFKKEYILANMNFKRVADLARETGMDASNIRRVIKKYSKDENSSK